SWRLAVRTKGSMMPPQYTYTLSIHWTCPNEDEAHLTKEQVMAWLTVNGAESFVEGVFEDLDVLAEAQDFDPNLYVHLAKKATPLEVYSYDPAFLDQLQAGLQGHFGEALSCQRTRLLTS